MNTLAKDLKHLASHPAEVHVEPATGDRDRLTCAFRLVLAIPHLLLVGGPIALTLSWPWSSPQGPDLHWGAGGGALGAVAAITAVLSWFAILFTGRHPAGLRDLSAFYLRWRVRAVSYTALLRDEYPPFGEGAYPAELRVEPTGGERDRLTVAFRIFLAIPHLLIVWALGMVWALSTLIAWFSILLTGRYPEPLYGFAVGVLRWNVRVEAYLLLLHDEYPPFSLD